VAPCSRAEKRHLPAVVYSVAVRPKDFDKKLKLDSDHPRYGRFRKKRIVVQFISAAGRAVNKGGM